jgi:hypothetical protein
VKKYSNSLIFHTFWGACHLQIDPDPDPAFNFNADPDLDSAYYFDTDPDPDPTFQFDADPDPQHRHEQY